MKNQVHQPSILIVFFMFLSHMIIFNVDSHTDATCSNDLMDMTPPQHHVIGLYKQLKEITPHTYHLILEVEGQQKVYYIHTPSNNYPSLLTDLTKKEHQNILIRHTQSQIEQQDHCQKNIFLQYLRDEKTLYENEQITREEEADYIAHQFEKRQQKKRTNRIENILHTKLNTLPYVYLYSEMQNMLSSKNFIFNRKNGFYISMDYNYVNQRSDDIDSVPHHRPIIIHNIEKILPLRLLSLSPFHTVAELIAWKNYTTLSLQKDHTYFYPSFLSMPCLAKNSVFLGNHVHFVDKETVMQQLDYFGEKGMYHEAYVLEVQDIETTKYRDYIDAHSVFPINQINPAIITLMTNHQKISAYTNDASLIEFAKVALKTNVQVTVTTHKMSQETLMKQAVIHPQRIEHCQILSSIGLSFTARLALSFNSSSMYPPVDSKSGQWFHHFMSSKYLHNIPKKELLFLAKPHQSFDMQRYNKRLDHLQLPLTHQFSDPEKKDIVTENDDFFYKILQIDTTKTNYIKMLIADSYLLGQNQHKTYEIITSRLHALLQKPCIKKQKTTLSYSHRALKQLAPHNKEPLPKVQTISP